MAAEGARSVWWPFTQHAHLRVHHQQAAEGAVGAVEAVGVHTLDPGSSSNSSGSSGSSISSSGSTSSSSGSGSSGSGSLPSGELTFIDSAYGDFFRTVTMEAAPVAAVPVTAGGLGGAGGVGGVGGGDGGEGAVAGVGAVGVGGIGGMRASGEVDMFDGCASWWTQVSAYIDTSL
jgi:hypothetical protein